MNGNEHKIAISLGGNQADTTACFAQAIKKIEKKIGTVNLSSSLYSTQAWGMKEGTNDFLNQVIVINSQLKPKKLLKATQKIERKLGRTSKSTNGNYKDRPIDIDIMFYDDRIIRKKNLTVPHPLLHTRKFILTPLSEIIPEYIHPVLKKTIKELLLSCSDKLEVKKQLQQQN